MSSGERPLDHRNFRFLLAAQVVDTAGNSVLRVVLPFAVLSVVAPAGDLVTDGLAEAAPSIGLVVASFSVGTILLMLVGGVVADRWPRSVVLVWSNAVAAIIDGVLAWSVLGGWATIPIMMSLAFLAGASGAMSIPAASAIVRQTVPPALLQSANATSSAARSVIRILSLVVGGTVAIAIGPGWGIAFNAVSFAVAALLFSAIRVDPIERRSESMLEDFREGWRTFVSYRWARIVVLSFMLMNAAFSGTLLVLGPIVASATFGETQWGWVLGAESIGLLIVGLVLSRFRHATRLSYGLVGAARTAPFMAVLGANAPSIGLVVLAGAVSGIGIGYFDVAWNVSLQTHIPEDKLSRVYSVDALGSMLAVPLGQTLVGPLAVAIGLSSAIFGLAGFVLVMALVTVAMPDVRGLGPCPVQEGLVA